MKRLLFVLPYVLLGAGCNAPATAPTPSSNAPTAPAAAPAVATAGSEAERFCEQKKASFAIYRTPWDDKQLTLNLPGNIPPMPEGAVLCGTAPTTHQAYYYYKTNRPQKEVMNGFIEAYKAAGWKTDSTISDRMSFNDNVPPGSPGSHFGGINYDTSDVELIFTYRTE